MRRVSALSLTGTLEILIVLQIHVLMKFGLILEGYFVVLEKEFKLRIYNINEVIIRSITE